MLLYEHDIVNFFADKEIDIRKTGNGRWIDQKCTADVVCAIADCVAQYIQEAESPDIEFNSRDIWFSRYSVDFVQNVFKKPNPEKTEARNEYDKFFMQPLELLASAGVLSKRKQGTRNIYKVANQDILNYIAFRERDALTFLYHYITKVLTDSGIIKLFNDFFNKQDKASYHAVKKAFAAFTKKYTPINGDTECNRIFIKVINPLAYKKNSKGTERGHMSTDLITFDMLMYNRDNFRDVYTGKPKSLTRKESAQIADQNDPNESYVRYSIEKAKRQLQKYVKEVYKWMTEYREGHHVMDNATQIHHIFPESNYPKIANYLENLIALTPTQHLCYAHPNNNTHVVDPNYQYLLLIAKMNRIREYLDANKDVPEDECFYTFKGFVTVLATGFERPEIADELMDGQWHDALRVINVHYNKDPNASPQVD